MTSMYATRTQVQQELSNLCAKVGVTTEGTAPALLNTTAADPRAALAQLRDALKATIYRERTAADGAEESFITVLDAIDRTVTIKIRRPLT
ncbi:hypothetical protein Y013_25110 (plasmid) [Rhodococcus pyridinivorans SB3094]|uniref:Uncharacterized protein n=1 Tax=Rhodococcus pyridinivorans SB3094 TaxID=1435356 RepID=V9XQK2_9NOCA|nr:hypothetical protein [Rhodococcus pyridinivorans]AHD24255.1 hypothetical protein Y013_25110 [Rhodococcus pyridinivorans SB3094]